MVTAEETILLEEIERLRSLLRACVRGTDIVDLGNGESVGLHLVNWNKAGTADQTGAPRAAE